MFLLIGINYLIINILQEFVCLEAINPFPVEVDVLPFLFGKDEHSWFSNYTECKSKLYIKKSKLLGPPFHIFK